jgi:membrane protein implicated in regulation of membrane protease activity
MKEGIKDTLFMFGIAIVCWILSIAITNLIFVWLLKWGLKIGAVLFIFGGIIAVINAVASHRNRNKNNDNNKPK